MFVLCAFQLIRISFKLRFVFLTSKENNTKKQSFRPDLPTVPTFRKLRKQVCRHSSNLTTTMIQVCVAQHKLIVFFSAGVLGIIPINDKNATIAKRIILIDKRINTSSQREAMRIRPI